MNTRLQVEHPVTEETTMGWIYRISCLRLPTAGDLTPNLPAQDI